ncbi:hypothetical protein [Alkaliphilus sp. B6464]|uniref:hypothetical protein n=1 Tax=Alkaliphilus sp. B6464 TaxID=2731219 RepID=UPI001BA5C09F|nr:hypothetical protein [Alkaliphilus sp. B6464]QUH21072.1 hypothetical protein HYG84_15090 [Alkaliphilus sp. B6464]
MEEILREILYELKEMRKELSSNEGNPIELKVTIGEDVIVEKVISNINKQNRISGKTVITV